MWTNIRNCSMTLNVLTAVGWLLMAEFDWYFQGKGWRKQKPKHRKRPFPIITLHGQKRPRPKHSGWGNKPHNSDTKVFLLCLLLSTKRGDFVPAPPPNHENWTGGQLQSQLTLLEECYSIGILLCQRTNELSLWCLQNSWINIQNTLNRATGTFFTDNALSSNSCLSFSDHLVL